MPEPVVDPEKKDSPPKLIAGKFKTVEEAEEAIKANERKITEQGNRIATLERDMKGKPEPAAAPDDGEESEFASAFLARPKTVLSSFGKKLLKQAVDEAMEQNVVYVETRLAVQEFTSEHPLSKKHAKLFNSFLSETDPNDTIQDRLGKAHKRLEGEISAVAEESKKTADAQRKASAKAAVSPGAEGEGELEAGGEVVEADDEPETPQDYLANRKKQYMDVRGAIV